SRASRRGRRDRFRIRERDTAHHARQVHGGAVDAGAGGRTMNAERAALRILQAGIITCVLAILPAPGVCLCNAPKELVLVIAATAAAALCIASCTGVEADRIDVLLLGFIVVSVASAGEAGFDRWEAMRALGISVAGAAVFWSARYLARR